MSEPDLKHQQLIAEANANIRKTQSSVQKDNLRPIFHMTPPTGWIGDPNGPIFYNNEYHVFYQHNPLTDPSLPPHHPAFKYPPHWGHASSKDLVHWKHWPVALAPNHEGYDPWAASGYCVVHENIPTIIYTGLCTDEPDNSQDTSNNEKSHLSPPHQVQCIARSYDGMRTWIKYPGNPVITTPPRDDLIGFRDPFVWREDDLWYMLLGSGIKDQGGSALLYRSTNLIEWEYLNPLCIDLTGNWECPNFFPLGDKHILIVSPQDGLLNTPKYSIGDYKDHKFTPGPWYELDLGGKSNFYAPSSMEDNNGRLIMWGWARGGGTKGYAWNGMHTLPRVLTLRPDGRLSIEPAQELHALRGRHHRLNHVDLTNKSPFYLHEVKGDCLEVIAEFELGNAQSIGLEVLCSPNRTEKVVVSYDRFHKYISIGNKGGNFELLDDERTLRIQVFVDRSIVEVYANGRACITNRIYPRGSENKELSLFALGGSAHVKSVDIWEMESIW